MNKMAKVLVTIVVVIVFLLLFGVLFGVRSDAGMATPGIFGLVLLAALIGALRAIWKKDKSGNGDNNSSVLQK